MKGCDVDAGDLYDLAGYAYVEVDADVDDYDDSGGFVVMHWQLTVAAVDGLKELLKPFVAAYYRSDLYDLERLAR